MKKPKKPADRKERQVLFRMSNKDYEILLTKMMEAQINDNKRISVAYLIREALRKEYGISGE